MYGSCLLDGIRLLWGTGTIVDFFLVMISESIVLTGTSRQADGLVGSKGILPAQKRVELYRSRLGQSPTWYLYPTLVLWGLADENVSVSSEGDAKTGGSVLPRFKFDTLLRFFWVSGMGKLYRCPVIAIPCRRNLF